MVDGILYKNFEQLQFWNEKNNIQKLWRWEWWNESLFSICMCGGVVVFGNGVFILLSFRFSFWCAVIYLNIFWIVFLFTLHIVDSESQKRISIHAHRLDLYKCTQSCACMCAILILRCRRITQCRFEIVHLVFSTSCLYTFLLFFLVSFCFLFSSFKFVFTNWAYTRAFIITYDTRMHPKRNEHKYMYVYSLKRRNEEQKKGNCKLK